MKKSLFYFSLLIISTFLSSCGLNQVLYSSKTVEKLDKIAVISSYVHFAPPEGFISAEIMKDKMNKISGDLYVLFNDYSTFYRDSIGAFISQNCNCEVFYGESLQKIPGFAKLKEDSIFKRSIPTGNPLFPYVSQSAGDINVISALSSLQLSTKQNPVLSANEKETVQRICNNLNVNFIVLSYTLLVAVPPSGYMMRGTLNVMPQMWILDKEGECIATFNAWSGGAVSAGKIESYPKVLDGFMWAIKPRLTSVLTKYSNK